MLVLACKAAYAVAPPVRRPAPALRDRPVTWSNPQGRTLTQVHDDVWLAERPFYPTLPGLQNTDVGCKACVIRLPDGKLWVHAPVALDPELRAALAEIGPVGHIVTPNTEHQKFAPSWILEYPDAKSFSCPGLREKKPEIGWQSSLAELLDGTDGVASAAPPAVWGGALELCWVRDQVPLTGALGSIPFFNEVVFFHRPSKTLIVTDLWWNYPRETSRLWKFGMDRIYKPVYNRLMRTESWDASYTTIMNWDFEYLAPTHGEPVAADGKAVLARHLGYE